MIRKKGYTNFKRDGVNCSFEIRDDFCVSKERAKELIAEIAEIAYPNLLEQYKRKLAKEKIEIEELN